MLVERRNRCILLSSPFHETGEKKLLFQKMSTRKLLEFNPNSTQTVDILNSTDFISTIQPATEIMEESCLFFEITHKYYIPFILLMGLLGNLISCIVFLSTHLKMRSSSYYLAALATADFGFLSMLLIVYLSNETHLELFNRNGWCQWIVYLSSTCSVLSVWLTVAFTVERFIAIQYPLQRPQMCTVSRAKLIVILISITGLVSQSYLFVTAGIVVVPNDQNNTNSMNVLPEQKFCGMKAEYHHFMQVITLIDTIISLICPVILIVVMNAMIARNLFLFRQKFIRHSNSADCWVYHTTNSQTSQNLRSSRENIGQRLAEFQSGSTNRRSYSNQSTQQIKLTDVAPMINFGRNLRMTTSEQQSETYLQNNPFLNRNAISVKNQHSITKMLLLISTVFILLNLPSYAIRIYIFFNFALWNHSTPRLLWCMQQSSMVLYYTNFSVNFLLYSVCGATFRRCLVQLFRKQFNAIRNFWYSLCRIKKAYPHQRSLNGDAELEIQK